MSDPVAKAFFDDEQNLWIDFDGKIPPGLLVKHPDFFLIEHDPPCRTMINLTKYIALIHDIRRF